MNDSPIETAIAVGAILFIGTPLAVVAMRLVIMYWSAA